MQDIQVVEAQSLVPVESVRVLPGPPPAIEILGARDFEAIDEVRVNDAPCPFFQIKGPRLILAQLPKGPDG